MSNLLPCSNRCEYLGGSDIAALFQPYTRKQLLLYKTHQIEPGFKGNIITAMGSFLEPHVLGQYEAATNSTTQRKVYFQNPEHPWQRGELDAYLPGIVIDAKTTASTTKAFANEWSRDIIPKSIVWQMSWYMYLSDSSVAHVPLFLRCSAKVHKIYTLERDPVREATMIQAAHDFWGEVLETRRRLGDGRGSETTVAEGTTEAATTQEGPTNQAETI